MTKTEIVGAAFRVWGRDFYQHTSLSRLAGELGVSKPALYRHFRNKQALLDAMTEYFFDDFAAFIRADYERAVAAGDREEGVFIALKSVTEYYARNVYTFIFSLINVYDRRMTGRSTEKHLNARGIDFGVFHGILTEESAGKPLLMHLVFATLTFRMAHFHQRERAFRKAPSGAAIQNIIAVIGEIIARGLGYSSEEIESLDFESLENRVAGTADTAEDEPLIKAVAGAVAEAGPWRASMDMVARRSGLSKSSLYGHFKNRQDMLCQLFLTGFRRIIAFAKEGMGQSTVPEAQLYLGIFSITVYLRSRPEILTALDWIRTRKLDLGRPEDPDFFRIFEDIQGGRLKRETAGGEEENRQLSHWILFLLINILMRRHKEQSLEQMPTSDIRTLFRFIACGLEGFKR
jgi:AcrR family transcriptional regulator